MRRPGQRGRGHEQRVRRAVRRLGHRRAVPAPLREAGTPLRALRYLRLAAGAKPLGPKGGEVQAARAVFDSAARQQATRESRSRQAVTTQARPPQASLPRRPRGECSARAGLGAALRRGSRSGRWSISAAPVCARAPPAAQAGPPRRCSASSSRSTTSSDGWAWVQLDARRLCRLRARKRTFAPIASSRRTGCARTGHIPLSRARRQSTAGLHAQHERRRERSPRRVRPSARLADGGYVPDTPHRRDRHCHAADFVAVAERFVGTPYVWGGKTRAGARLLGSGAGGHAGGRARMPRATATCSRPSSARRSMHERARPACRRGDLVFWKGHVGIMTDGFHAAARQRPSYGGGGRAVPRCRRPHRPLRFSHCRDQADRAEWCLT